MRFKRWVKILVLVLLVRPFVWYFLGLNRYSRLRDLPEGPFILAPNHNSHLDTILLFGLLPLDQATRASFVAAGDYFFRIPVLSWVLFSLFDMVPVWRKGAGDGAPGPYGHAPAIEAMASVLQEGRVLVLFPEGTRGLPEQRTELKRGIARVATKVPEAPIVPVYLRGAGKCLPRGEMVFIPLIPEVVLGRPIDPKGKNEDEIMEQLAAAYAEMEDRVYKKDWVAV